MTARPTAGRVKTTLIVAVFALAGTIASLALAWTRTPPVRRDLLIGCRQYAYEPPVLHVNRGDTLDIRLVSLDVVHGFFVEGHDLDAEVRPQEKTFRIRRPSTGEEWREVETATIIAGAPGKYRYRCSHTCGTMHAFMQGELIVEPNLPFRGAVGGLIGLFVGMTIAAWRGDRGGVIAPVAAGGGR